MFGLVSAIFFASVLGSLHCAGMCGAFLALAVTTPPEGDRTPWQSHAMLQFAYHIGRLATYCTLGGLAGAMGSVIDLGTSMVGLQRAASLLAACTILAFGVVTLLRIWGVSVPRFPIPPAIQRAAIKGHQRAMMFPPLLRASTIGLLTTLLPCGWLYTFVIVAAGTANAGHGILVMAIFWIGTLPILVALGVGLRSLAGRIGPLLPMATAIFLVLAGGATLLDRARMIGVVTPAAISLRTHDPRTHANDRVSQLRPEGAACCNAH